MRKPSNKLAEIVLAGALLGSPCFSQNPPPNNPYTPSPRNFSNPVSPYSPLNPLNPNNPFYKKNHESKKDPRSANLNEDLTPLYVMLGLAGLVGLTLGFVAYKQIKQDIQDSKTD